MKIDVILTSYNRFDLLERTLDSFFRYNTYQDLGNFIILDDYGWLNLSEDQKKHLSSLQVKFNQNNNLLLPSIWWLMPPERRGQIASIDSLWDQTTTDYVFTLEDDWEFYRPGFIEESLRVLKDAEEKRIKVIQCWLREQTDTNQHPITKIFNLSYDMMSLEYSPMWRGFSFNPGLRRRVDYDLSGGYGKLAKFEPTRPWESEIKIGQFYAAAGYQAAITRQGYVKHIGGNGREIRH